MPAEAIVHKVAIADGELSDLEWHSIAQARTLELPNITRVVLEDLGERIAAGALHTSDVPVPVLSSPQRQLPARPDRRAMSILTNGSSRVECAPVEVATSRPAKVGIVMAKPITQKIKLLSTAGTGFFYVTKKNPRTATDKLSFKKYDPVARKHVAFKETKIK